jgi:YidC/Oxa1 family membrane protein insertase
MDRKTLIAVVASVVVIVGGMLLQQVIFPPKPKTEAAPAPQTGQPTTSPQPAPEPQKPAEAPAPGPSTAKAPGAAVAPPGKIVPVADEGGIVPTSGTFVRETDLYRLTFSRDGAALSSVELKSYKNVDGTLVNMVITADKGQLAFDTAFGDYTAPLTQVPFAVKETVDSGKNVFDFSRTFLSPAGVPFTLRKTYTFYQGEYMMQLDVTIENSVNDIPTLGTGTYAYTLSYGPQIGPGFAKLDQKNDYRSFMYLAGGGHKDLGAQSGNTKEIDQRVTWAGVVGKYFTVIAVPLAADYRIVFDARKIDPKDRSTLFIERPALKSSKNVDRYRFYIGPKKRDILTRYNNIDQNKLESSGLMMEKVVPSNFFGFLVTPLKWLLELFYKLIPNYGIAIILLTLIIKLVFLPLTFKSSEATARMQSLNPKMQEIRTRLKDKPDKMNQEIALLYKKEKVNPLSGCLPLLLQIPIFFALYALLNDHFDLRGAMFIPGWIPDLSVPEAIVNFNFTIPLVNWTALRALPLLMLATQFLQTKFTQPADATQSGAQMKLFSYVLPAVFLFILYDMPSGLVLYWTVQNVLSILQQLYINRVNKRKKELAANAIVVDARPNVRRKSR